MVTVQEIIKQLTDQVHPEKLGNVNINELAVNCVSLSQVWLAGQKKSIMVKTFGEEGEEIDCIYGINEDNLPLTLAKICIEPNKTKIIRVFSFENKDGKVVSDVIGVMEIN